MRHKKHGFNPWVEKIPRRRIWQPTPVLLPGLSHGQRSLVGYSPWGCTELDTIEWLSTDARTQTSMHVDCAWVLSKCQKEWSRIINTNTERFPRHIKFFLKSKSQKNVWRIFRFVKQKGKRNDTGKEGRKVCICVAGNTNSKQVMMIIYERKKIWREGSWGDTLKHLSKTISSFLFNLKQKSLSQSHHQRLVHCTNHSKKLWRYESGQKEKKKKKTWNPVE